ncbi:hypothetical protein [Streptomyces bambusae]|uniref:Muconolactone isomerase domain-containing protein n=1 Tax=Streptomyces bambusae TaxID=1550616 RepID=A0ABS6Z1C4_9ACTN|nr:hypothetical protein [Streptomyces bambusae]MBW5481522.1 hypothetical protein [Streptomyces bambusae]
MRVMLRAHIDTPAGNEGLKSGALPQSVKRLVDAVKPEAAYFGLSEGVRTCWIVFDLNDSAQIPPLVEDLFMQFNAEIEVSPVMDQEGLQKGLSAMKATG